MTTSNATCPVHHTAHCGCVWSSDRRATTQSMDEELRLRDKRLSRACARGDHSIGLEGDFTGENARRCHGSWTTRADSGECGCSCHAGIDPERPPIMSRFDDAPPLD